MTGARPDGALVVPADVVAVGGGAMVDPECLRCGKHFRPRRDVGKAQRFCSAACRGAFYDARSIGGGRGDGGVAMTVTEPSKPAMSATCMLFLGLS